MAKICLGPYLITSPDLGSSESTLVDPQKTRRIVTVATGSDLAKPSADAILLHAYEKNGLSVRYWDIPSSLGRTYTILCTPERVYITSFENGLQSVAFDYGVLSFEFGKAYTVDSFVEISAPCKAVFEFDGRDFEVSGQSADDYGLFSTSSIGFGKPLDPDYQEIPTSIPTTPQAVVGTELLGAIATSQVGKNIDPENRAKWNGSFDPSLTIENANNPAIATLVDGRSILVYETADDSGNIVLAAKIIGTSVNQKIVYYRAMGYGRLVNGSNPLTLETFDDMFVATNSGVPTKELYIGFLSGPLKGVNARITSFERQTYTDSRPRVKNVIHLQDTVVWEGSNDIDDIQWFMSEGVAPVSSETLLLQPHYADGSLGYTAQIAHPSVAIATNNVMSSGDQHIFIAYQAFSSGVWGVYLKHIVYTNGLLYSAPQYESPYSFQSPDLTQVELTSSPYSTVVYKIKEITDTGHQICASFTTKLPDGRKIFNCNGVEGDVIYGPSGVRLDDSDGGVFVTFSKDLCSETPNWSVGDEFTGTYPPVPETLGYTGDTIDGIKRTYDVYSTGISLQSINNYSYPRITALVDYSGDLVAFGPFKNVNGLENTENVFRWSGGSVSSFGAINFTGFQPQGTAILNSTLYAWGLGAPFIVYWTGSAWTTVAGGIATRYLEYYDGDLVKSDGGSILGFTGTAWAILSATNPPTNCAGILVYDSDLYIVSHPTPQTTRVHKWDGASYSTVIDLNGVGTCLVEFDGKLVVGGSLTSIYDTDSPLTGLAIFDGTSWGQFGGFQGMDVKTVAVSDDSFFFAGLRNGVYEIWFYWKDSATWRQIDSSDVGILKIWYLDGNLFVTYNENSNTPHDNMSGYLEGEEHYNQCFDIVPTPSVNNWCFFNAKCYQYFVNGDAYCPSPYVALRYIPTDLYTLTKNGEVYTRVWYNMSASLDTPVVTTLPISESGIHASSIVFKKSDCEGFPPSQILECSVSPDELDFGTINHTGDYNDQTITITKDTPGTVNLSIEGTDAQSFAFLNDTQVWSGIVDSTGTDIVVRFLPTTDGVKTASIISDCPFTDCSNDVSLSGTAAFSPECLVIPPILSFGSVVVDEVVTSTFIVKNVGGGQLTGTADLVSNDGEFELVGDTSYSLEKNQEQIITVQFSPVISSLGQRFATIDVPSGCTIAVNGISSETTQCDVSPQILDLGNIVLGGSVEGEIVITNSSDSNHITGVVSLESDGEQFEVTSGNGFYDLDAGESLTVRITFIPTEIGSWNRILQTGYECSTVVIRGTGYDLSACDVYPEQIDLGEIPTGEETRTYVTLSHLVGGSVSGTATLIQDGTTFSFVSGGGNYWLDPGQSRIIQIACLPFVDGTYSAILSTSCGNVTITATSKTMFDVGEILERDDAGYESTFLKKASILITYAGDLSENWPNNKEDLTFVDNVVTTGEYNKGLYNLPYPLSAESIFGVDAVHIVGDTDKWIYFEGRGPLALMYNQFGVPGKPGSLLPYQSDPILLGTNAFRPKVAVNNRNQVIVAYEQVVDNTTQLVVKGTSDFAQDSIFGAQPSRLTRPLMESDFAFEHRIDSSRLNQLCDMVIDKNDVTHIAWQSNQDGSWNIYYANGLNCFESTKITQSKSQSGFPSIEVDSGGGIYVAYHDNRFGPYQIMLVQKNEKRYPSLLEQGAYLSGYRSGISHHVNVVPILVTNEWKERPQTASLWAAKNNSEVGNVDNYIFEVDPLTGGVVQYVDCSDYQVAAVGGRYDNNFALTRQGELLRVDGGITYLGIMHGVTLSASALSIEKSSQSCNNGYIAISPCNTEAVSYYIEVPVGAALLSQWTVTQTVSFNFGWLAELTYGNEHIQDTGQSSHQGALLTRLLLSSNALRGLNVIAGRVSSSTLGGNSTIYPVLGAVLGYETAYSNAAFSVSEVHLYATYGQSVSTTIQVTNTVPAPYPKSAYFGSNPSQSITKRNDSDCFSIAFNPSITVSSTNSSAIVPYRIAANTSANVNITFTAESTPGVYECHLEVYSERFNTVNHCIIYGHADAPPFGQLDKISFNRQSDHGSSISDKDTVILTNIGGSVLYYTPSIKVASMGEIAFIGSFATTGPATLSHSDSVQIEFSYDAVVATLDVGTYTWEAYVDCQDSSGGNQQRLTILFSLEVLSTDKPFIVLDPTTIIISGQRNTEEYDSFTISNTGTETLDYEISSNASWLQIDTPLTGTIDVGDPSASKNITMKALLPGSYYGTIVVRSQTGSIVARNNPQIINVVRTVLDDNPTMSVIPDGTPPEIVVNHQFGGATVPTPVIFTVSNAGGYTLNYSVSESSPYVSASYAGGISKSLSRSQTQQVTVTFLSTVLAMPVGEYNIPFIFSANGNVAQLTRNVRLNITPNPVPNIKTSVDQIDVHIIEGENVTSTPEFSVWNDNAYVEITYSIVDAIDTCATSWITGVVPSSGTLGSTSCIVTLDTTGLTSPTAPTHCQGHLTISDTSPGLAASKNIGINLYVNPSNSLSLSPSTIALEVPEGSDAAAVTIIVTNIATIPIDFSVIPETLPSFVITPSGTQRVSSMQTSSFNLNFSTANLSAGEYTAVVDVVPLNSLFATKSITITLSVGAWVMPGVSVYPSTIIRKVRTGNKARDASVSIMNNGSFDIEFNTSTSSPWLSSTASQTSVAIGRTESIVLSFDSELLPSGRYDSNLIINVPATNPYGNTGDVDIQITVPVTLFCLEDEMQVVDIEVDAAARLWVCLTGQRLDALTESLMLRHISTNDASVLHDVSVIEGIDSRVGGLAVTTDNDFYVLAYKDGECQLYYSPSPTIQTQGDSDIALFAFSKVGAIAVNMKSLSCDEENNLYALSEANEVYLINKESCSTTLLSTIVTPTLSPPYDTAVVSGIGHFITSETTAYGEAGVYHVYVEFYDNPKLEGKPQVVVDSRIDTEAFLAETDVDPYYLPLELSVGSGIYLLPGQSGYLNFNASLFRPGATNRSYPYGFDRNKAYYPKVFVIDKFGSVYETTSKTIATLSCSKCVRVSPNTVNTSMCSYSFIYSNG